jgi:hypothetical protein
MAASAPLVKVSVTFLLEILETQPARTDEAVL